MSHSLTIMMIAAGLGLRDAPQKETDSELIHRSQFSHTGRCDQLEVAQRPSDGVQLDELDIFRVSDYSNDIQVPCFLDHFRPLKSE